MCSAPSPPPPPPPPPPLELPPEIEVPTPTPPPPVQTAPQRLAKAPRTNTQEEIATRTGSDLAIRRRKKGKSSLKISGQSGGMNYPGY